MPLRELIAGSMADAVIIGRETGLDYLCARKPASFGVLDAFDVKADATSMVLC